LNLGNFYGIGAVQVFPALKIRGDDGQIQDTGVDLLKEVVAKRGNYERLLEKGKGLIEQLIMMSGGNIRDLLRLLGEVILRATELPATEAIVQDAVNQMRTELLPIANDDARWLAEIAKTHKAALDSVKKLPTLSRFFDTHVVLCYRNGPEWYDVHPLIKEHVLAQAAELEKRKAANPQDSDDGGNDE
jgi:hypothetical protein